MVPATRIIVRMPLFSTMDSAIKKEPVRLGRVLSIGSRLMARDPRPETVYRLAAHKTYSTPAGRAMPTPGPKGRPSIIQITRKMIQAICRTTAMGIMLEIRVPMAQSGMYFS